MVREIGWLIESAGRREYWTGNSKIDFKLAFGKHDEAVRFARFQDAERVRLTILNNPDLISTEHVWLDGAMDGSDRFPNAGGKNDPATS